MIPLIQACAVLFYAFIFILIFLILFLKYFKDAKIWEDSVENIEVGVFFFFLNDKLRLVFS